MRLTMVFQAGASDAFRAPLTAIAERWHHQPEVFDKFAASTIAKGILRYNLARLLPSSSKPANSGDRADQSLGGTCATASRDSKFLIGPNAKRVT